MLSVGTVGGARRVGVYSAGQLATPQAKMAHGILRYADDVAVVIDAANAGRVAAEVVAGVDADIPIVATILDAVSLGMTELVIGVAPPGGEVDVSWNALLRPALDAQVTVINGLHTRLATLPEFADVPPQQIVDLRHLDREDTIAHGAAADVTKRVVLTVGTDCATGKMSTALELHRASLQRGIASDFIPTGQAGMYIARKGVAIDAVVADFMAGAIEHLVVESAASHDVMFVEGQGSLIHPAYSGVSLALLHGAAPDRLIFCHALGRATLKYFDRRIPDLREQIDLVERLACLQRECRVEAVAISSNGHELDEVVKAADRLESELGLPVFDPWAFGLERIVDRLLI